MRIRTFVAAGAFLVGGTAFLARGTDPGADTAVSWDEADWRIFSSKIEWARTNRLDTLPLGEAMARLGRTFVGTAYVPRTLEAPGPEHLVVNLRGLDCVTFVENMLAMARFVAGGGADLLARPDDARRRYEALLTEIRYRDGRIDGYPSRLHYFTDWIEDNARRGIVEDVTAELGGIADHDRIDFMSTHPEAYRQLSDPANLAAVRAAEERLTATARSFVPQNRIERVADRIHDGDIIAATSTVEGLDVAHTGLALWIDGTLHLLHAPLVGESVQISTASLAERIRRIDGQDGIMVARPREVR